MEAGGAVALELGDARAVNSAGALGRDPVEEAAIDATTLLLRERERQLGEAALVACPEEEDSRVLTAI